MVENKSRGVVLVDKPAGMTSHDVVARLRRIYGQRRIGHSGTLDPEATGLLVVAIGNITRLLDYFQASSKRYVGEVVFGVETDSYDSSGAITATYDMGPLDTSSLDAAIISMLGEIMQLPPVVSAIKIKGKKLYQYHRDNEDVKIKPRNVRIDSITYSSTTYPNVIRLEVVCGAGTYVRSIAHDLGRIMGGGAHLRNLRRLESGKFSVDEAIELEKITPETILAPSSALRDFIVIGVGPDVASAARNGVALDGELFEGEEVILYEERGGPLNSWDQVIGLYKKDPGNLYRPSVVLPATN